MFFSGGRAKIITELKDIPEAELGVNEMARYKHVEMTVEEFFATLKTIQEDKKEEAVKEEAVKEEAVKEEEYFAGLWQQLSNTRTHSDMKKAIIQELKDAGRWTENLED